MQLFYLPDQVDCQTGEDGSGQGYTISKSQYQKTLLLEPVNKTPLKTYKKHVINSFF